MVFFVRGLLAGTENSKTAVFRISFLFHSVLNINLERACVRAKCAPHCLRTISQAVRHPMEHVANEGPVCHILLPTHRTSSLSVFLVPRRRARPILARAEGKKGAHNPQKGWPVVFGCGTAWIQPQRKENHMFSIPPTRHGHAFGPRGNTKNVMDSFFIQK